MLFLSTLHFRLYDLYWEGDTYIFGWDFARCKPGIARGRRRGEMYI